MSKAFTLIELLIVISIISLVLGVYPLYYDKYLKDEVLERTANKMKYDIVYMQNLALSKKEKYMMAFNYKISNLSAENFDYICFVDKNNNNKPDFSYIESKNEILKSEFNKKYLIYDFDRKKYTNRFFSKVRLSNFDFSGKNIIKFNDLGGIDILKNEVWEEIRKEMSIEIKAKKSEDKRHIRIKALSLDIKID